MKPRHLKIILCLIILFGSSIVFLFYQSYFFSRQFVSNIPIFIAHGGGKFQNHTRSNTKDALDYNYSKGFRCFELDFSWTNDNKLVLIHDWNNSAKELFEKSTGRLSHEDFLNRQTRDNLILLDIEKLLLWLNDHQDVTIITDVKNKNLEALLLIKTKNQNLFKKFVPQIYSFQEYNIVKNIGFDKIILTLYRSNYSDDEILSFARKSELFAITMPTNRSFSGLPKKLSDIGVPVYAHTVNNYWLFKLLRVYAVFGVYTDTLL